MDSKRCPSRLGHWGIGNIMTTTFSRRQATASEIETLGFKILNGMAQSPKTSAFYDLEDFFVANSTTIEGERKFGQFLYLDSELPASEKVMIEINA